MSVCTSCILAPRPWPPFVAALIEKARAELSGAKRVEARGDPRLAPADPWGRDRSLLQSISSIYRTCPRRPRPASFLLMTTSCRRRPWRPGLAVCVGLLAVATPASSQDEPGRRAPPADSAAPPFVDPRTEQLRAWLGESLDVAVEPQSLFDVPLGDEEATRSRPPGCARCSRPPR